MSVQLHLRGNSVRSEVSLVICFVLFFIYVMASLAISAETHCLKGNADGLAPR